MPVLSQVRACTTHIASAALEQPLKSGFFSRSLVCQTPAHPPYEHPAAAVTRGQQIPLSRVERDRIGRPRCTLAAGVDQPRPRVVCVPPRKLGAGNGNNRTLKKVVNENSAIFCLEDRIGSTYISGHARAPVRAAQGFG